jgi:hypothetical protein
MQAINLFFLQKGFLKNSNYIFVSEHNLINWTEGPFPPLPPPAATASTSVMPAM